MEEGAENLIAAGNYVRARTVVVIYGERRTTRRPNQDQTEEKAGGSPTLNDGRRVRAKQQPAPQVAVSQKE